MGALAADIMRVALGVDVPFSWPFWLLVTTVWLLVGPPLVAVAPRVIDPIAAQLVARPDRIALWLPLSVLATIGCTLFLAITIVGIPLTVLIAIAVPIAMGLGYLGAALALGDMAARHRGHTWPSWAAAALGIVMLRLIRMVPLVGAAAQTLVVWIGFAATTSLVWAAMVSWHRRRMPDVVQFEGETLVEWYPDGDPADGRPSVGTGRPVVGNLRGEEDRRSLLEEDPEDTDANPRKR